MFYFTKYAEQKFDILNKHRVFFTKTDIKEVVKSPNEINKKGKYLIVKKDNIKVVYLKENELIKIITFYPV